MLLVGGVKGFIYGVEGVLYVFGVLVLLLLLIIVLIVMELLEKVNSVLWICCGKDMLVFGNIIGVMVF